MSRFRSFLYIDHVTVESMLSGVEGGTFDSEEQRDTDGSNWDARAGVRAGPVDAGASSGSRGGHERNRAMRQNAEARFSRLVREIDDDPDESVLQYASGSANPWSEAEEGRFCRFTGDLEVSEFVVALVNSAEYLRIGQAFQRAGAIDFTSDQREALEGMASVNDAIGKTLPVLMRLHADHPTLILNLSSEMTRQSIERYQGRATVFGRVSEKIPERTRHTLLTLPGARQMNRRQRRAQGANAQNFEIEGPAIMINVLAIYQ